MSIIDIEHGNLLSADAEALVNTVNCVGVMGKGIALHFKQAFPENFRHYRRACRNGQVAIGQMFIVPTNNENNPKFIVNFPTKRNWKGKSRIDDIEAGLSALIDEVKRLHINSIAVPPLGCGNGGLDWADVKPRIVAAFAEVPEIVVLRFSPSGAPEPRAMPIATKKPRMTRTRAILIQLLNRYGIPGYDLTLLEIQKLAYFLQLAGEPMKLQYVKNKYGPYAEKLNHVLQHLEGHYIRGYGDRSRQALIAVLPEAVIAASDFLNSAPEAQERLARVSQLIHGFETPYGMELLASVHWVAHQSSQQAISFEEIVTVVHTWDERKQQLFKPAHIHKAWQRLTDERWLGTEQKPTTDLTSE